LKRIRGFEFEDAGWFPAILRDYMTEYLGAAVERLDLFAPAADVISDGLSRSGAQQIVDLGSGAGRVWRKLAPALQSKFDGLRITLTDAYPHGTGLGTVEADRPAGLRYESRAVRATEVPGDLTGLRTMFLVFHHFEPQAAQGILADAVAKGQPLVIFEGQRRDLRHLIQIAISPLAVLLMTPAIRPFRLGRILFTYLIPIVPLLVGWDGVVSVLRTYTENEMRQLVSKADPEARFTWEMGELASGMSVVPYLLGLP
jgi:hypothetical protein